MAEPLDDYARAIGQIESGGNYHEGGKPTRGHYPVGKYQVMDYNVGPWTKSALGQAMTPQQFLNDPAAQDAVFRNQFGGYVAKYGNPQDAASVWLSGRPLAQATAAGAHDLFGTTSNEYVDRFNRALGMPQAPVTPYPTSSSPAASTPGSAVNTAGMFMSGAPSQPEAPVPTQQASSIGSALQDYGKNLQATQPTPAQMLALLYASNNNPGGLYPSNQGNQ